MLRSEPSLYELQKLKLIAEYQFGRRAGAALFSGEGLQLTHSRNTRRIRHIFLNGKLIATLRPKDGLLALTPYSGQILLKKLSYNELPCIIVKRNVIKFIQEGRNLFSKHVIFVSPDIRAGDEVLVVDENHKLVAVGKSALSADEIRDFKVGVAVKIRWGTVEKPIG
jgi:predicted RNA-binding protein (TIGR00451 family)